MLEIEHILRSAHLSAAQYERVRPAAQAFGNTVCTLFSPVDAERILLALSLMLDIHRVQQSRPDSSPYIEHPLAVAGGVLDAMAHKDPDLVIAALLHDAVEDQEEKLVQKATTEERAAHHNNKQEIALAVIERYTHSRRVRDLVVGLTNPDFHELLAKKGVQRGTDAASQQAYTQAKNTLYAEHVREAIKDPDVALIKLFDFSTNVLSLAGVPNEATRKRYTQKYETVIGDIIDRLRDTSRPLNILPEKREALLVSLIAARSIMQESK